VREEVLREIGGGFAAVVPLAADDIARAILYALAQPAGVSVNEILLRPSNQPM
jgi:NADP-dependent 3-hydroxy acid dehydrogenase YdfG